VHEKTWINEQDYNPVRVYLGDVYRQIREKYQDEGDFKHGE
jgi:hypothetical protein